MDFTKLIFILIFTLFSKVLIGQSNNSYAEFREVYGLKVKVVKKLVTKKMKCGIGLSEERKNTLYEIKIEEILFSRDSTVYNSHELEKVKYVILPTLLKVNASSVYYLLGGNSSVEDYIVGFRIFEENQIPLMANTDQHSIFQGLETCYKLSLFDKLKLAFGVDESKVYNKKRDEKKENKFCKFIAEIAGTTGNK